MLFGIAQLYHVTRGILFMGILHARSHSSHHSLFELKME